MVTARGPCVFVNIAIIIVLDKSYFDYGYQVKLHRDLDSPAVAKV